MHLRDRAVRRDRPGRFWDAVALAVVRWRYLILIGWIAAAVLATVFLPGISSSGAIGNLVPENSAALRAEADATRLFGLPLTSGVEVVQRDPRGFPRAEQVRAEDAAVAVDQGRVHGIYGLVGALPVVNTARLVPGVRERSTTIVTALYFMPGTSLDAQTRGGHEYVRRYLSAPQDHVVGVTGVSVARDAQAKIILAHLPWVELATILAIAVIVSLRFGSAGAPLATLACAGIAYLVAVRVVAWAGQLAGISVPPDLEPVLVVLLLGVTTDYSVFFLAGMRGRLAEGDGRMQAARRVTARYLPIIVTAGLVVAGGSASLGAARLAVLHALGPGLALTVLTAMVVAVTLTPALIAVFGRLLFLPGWAPRPGRNWRERVARAAAGRRAAALIAAGCVAGLLIMAAGVAGMRLAVPLIRALPGGSEAVRAQAAAAQGFVPGILAPTEILVLGPGVGTQRAALARLEHALAARPGVAAVVGPPDVTAAEARRLLVAGSGNAVRLAVIEKTDPLGATAIGQVRALREDLPALARSAGLAGARFEVGGETAISADAIDALLGDLWRVGLAVALVTVVLLAVFLRALLAPLYLLASSVLALFSAFGLTVWIFQAIAGYDGLVYYVPVAVAVLLVALGSDYNVFVVGHIWDEARRRPLRDAVVAAVPRASRAIGTAGIALAASFALLALVPLDQFREMAAAIALGVLIDTFIVRSLLVPALVVLTGSAGRWPARGYTPRPGAGHPPPGPARAEPAAAPPESVSTEPGACPGQAPGARRPPPQRARRGHPDAKEQAEPASGSHKKNKEQLHKPHHTSSHLAMLRHTNQGVHETRDGSLAGQLEKLIAVMQLPLRRTGGHQL